MAEYVKSLAHRLRLDAARLGTLAGQDDIPSRADILAAARLLERSVFHLDRATSNRKASEVVVAEEGEMLDVEIEKDLLEANRAIAEVNRAIFAKHGILSIDVMGSVGSGKTSLIAAMVERLGGRLRCGMLGGDVATSIDADRIREKGAETVQVNTGKECHLDANLVRRALDRFDLSGLDVLFVENVGNLICPSEFDLGCSKRAVVISVTEGESMVVKHPMIFADADVVAINKIDMADVFGTDVEKLEADLAFINPRTTAVRTSATRGLGIESLMQALSLPP